MSNVVPLFKPKPPAKRNVYLDRGAIYTLEDMKKYNFRGTFPDGVTKVNSVNVGQGAMIASLLKNDQEAAKALLEYYNELVLNRKQYGTIDRLPAYARGYVENIYRKMLGTARATVGAPVR